MKKSFQYILKKIEIHFVFIVLFACLMIYYFIPNKTDFLNFFYLPILLASYVVGKRYSMFVGLLSVMIIGIIVYYSPQAFFAGKNTMDMALTLSTWGGFLVLSGYMTGSLQEKIVVENKKLKILNENIQNSNLELETLNQKLEENNKDLAYRTEQLLEKNTIVNHLKGRLEKTLYSTMDTNVAKLIIENRLNTEKSHISILFADLVEFSDFSDKYRPEVVINELNRVFGRIEPIIFNYKGHIDKYLGDEIMCEFGAPVNYKLHALHAVVAGLKMQECLRKLDQPWKMRVGISTGYAVTGLIGQKKSSYTAIGSIVNLADRLQEICPHNSIIVEESTFQEIVPYVEYRKLKALEFQKDQKKMNQFTKKIESSLKRLKENPKNQELLFELGKLYFNIYDVTNAVEYFGRALEIDPDNAQFKIAYADAIIKRDEYEKIAIRGKKERIAVYEILGIKNPLKDQNKIPKSFYEKYKVVEHIIQNIEDIILPVEVIDGSIGGSKIVAIISYAIATELRLSDSKKEKIVIGAYLRDIGKEKVPHYLLNQEGILTSSEFKEIMRHSLEGSVTLQTMGYENEIILNIVRDHHEYFDGCGYPEGKKGEGIPLEARIVAIADAYNALTSTRPYREPWDRDAALREIEKCALKGKYDKKILDIFLKVMQ